MKGPQGSLRGGGSMWKRAYQKKKNRATGVKVPSSHQERRWMNIKQRSWIFYGVLSPLPSPLSALSDFVFFRPLIYFLVFISHSSTSLRLAAARLRTWSPLPRGAWSPSRPRSNRTCPRDFWSFVQSSKKTLGASTVGTGVENFVFTIFYIFLSRSLHPPIGEAWLASQ